MTALDERFPIEIAREDWAKAIGRARRRGRARGYATAPEWLSDYEPCESCGTGVVALKVHDRLFLAEVLSLHATTDPTSDSLRAHAPAHTPERCRSLRTVAR